MTTEQIKDILKYISSAPVYSTRVDEYRSIVELLNGEIKRKERLSSNNGSLFKFIQRGNK